LPSGHARSLSDVAVSVPAGDTERRR
jgi:hypothetical protein